MKKSTVAIITGLLLVGGFVQYQSHVNVVKLRRSVGIAFKSPQAMISPDMIQVIAGEFNGVLADYMLLEVGSFIGSNMIATASDYQNIYHALKQSLVLDPYFQQTYLFIQGILPWKAHMVDEAIDLLKISRDHRPWDWRPGNYIGFDYYYFKNDFAKASDAFLETAKIKNAPLLIAILGSRFAIKGQRTEAAMEMLKQMLKDEALVESDHREVEQRLAALSGVLLLEKAVEHYRTQTNSYPCDLQLLVKERLITAMPHNPYADKFYYDPQTGRVTFDQVKTITEHN